MNEQQPNPEPVRLNKYIASVMSIGRRQVDYLVQKGKIKVNGQTPELGARVTPSDQITVDGKPLAAHEHPLTYLAFNKPAGYVCSRRQQGRSPTIYSLLPAEYQHLKTVGRLDKDSSGLILLTNDGDFAHRMTHPSFIKHKVYEVTLRQPLQPLHRQMISDIGVQLPDGPSRFELSRLADGDDYSWQVTMHEGRNRQIRRTFSALGYDVTRLHRTQFGTYQLANQQAGKIQEIKL